ncbi:Polyketide cyclase SnoaL domain-containing protein [Heracleum sosnowskyi]|uniref:Polyketide cyclase SnoaL domain-containing protein n=1 Tax=Heracleum sosnowskyi TaxID=360622 RepID=A0AAD8ICJ1_9APIA|nr:Polyketide cyclase SnoaL domain-containing protein [Heracleum sosnowskyi]
MSSLSLPSTSLQLIRFPLKFDKKKSFYNVKYNKTNSAETTHVSGSNYSYHDHAFIKTRFLPSYSGLSFVARNAKGPGGEEDGRALETVLKLYTAIKDRDLDVLSDVIGEECRCVCNFVSAFQPWEGKTQVLEFFSYLLRKLGENIEFVVEPTFHDGMTVGVHWKLEWKETRITLGEGFSFYMCHVYQGKVLIKNVEMFMEPLLHIEPLRLKIMGTIMNAIDKFGSTELSMDMAKGIIKHTLLALLIFVAALAVILRFVLD